MRIAPDSVDTHTRNGLIKLREETKADMLKGGKVSV